MPFSESMSTNNTPRHAVSTLELFFDLVFVFTLTGLTALIERDLSWTSLLQVVLIFTVLFWMYGAYAWLTNEVPPETDSRRLLMFAGMAAFLTCASATQSAFGDRALTFALGYTLVVLVHTGLYAQVAGRDVIRFATLNLLGAGALIAASASNGWIVYLLWTIPLVLQWIAPRLVRRAGDTREGSAPPVFSLDADHFVERHGLLLIVALGESVVAVGVGLRTEEPTVGRYLATGLGLVIAAAFWWAYFRSDDALAQSAMERSAGTERVSLAVNGFFYAYIPMLLGVIAVAAGIVRAISQINQPLDQPHAWLLAAGVATYVGGTAAFRWAVRITPTRTRVLAAALALGSVVLGVGFDAQVQLAALAGLLVLMLLVEHRTSPACVARS